MLRIQNVTKAFGALMAVHDVSLEIGDAGITGLVGPNGSGKSTLFHLITGFYRLDHGAIFFGRHSIGRLPPHKISRLGLIRSFQHTRPLQFMTVLDNLIAAAPGQAGERIWPLFLKPARVRREENDLRERARDILKSLDLLPLADELAGSLSYGQQKLMELARILMAGSRLILLTSPRGNKSYFNPTVGGRPSSALRTGHSNLSHRAQHAAGSRALPAFIRHGFGRAYFLGNTETSPGRTSGHRSLSGAGKPCCLRWSG